jgi:hypothetical protein
MNNLFKKLNAQVQQTALSSQKLGSRILQMKKNLLVGGYLKKNNLKGGYRKKTVKNPLKKAERVLRNYYKNKYSIGNKNRVSSKKLKRKTNHSSKKNKNKNKIKKTRKH